jgi:hypothetical protein
MSHARKAAEIDARDIKVHFPPAVTSAFGELEAAVRSSEHFDADILRIVQDYAAGKTKSVHSALITIPAIAEEKMKHVRATGDTRAEQAWHEIAVQMNEGGFSLTQERVRRK